MPKILFRPPKLLSLSLSFGLVLTSIAPTLALSPSSIAPGADINWSQIIEDPFDGPVVHDRNFNQSFAFVSSWSPQGIRATYYQYEKELVGYRTVWRTRNVYINGQQRQEQYPEQEPIYEQRTIESVPKEIQLSLNGQVYTYVDGPVSSDLAAALRQAPNTNIMLRVKFDNERTKDIEIGRNTARAWRTLFAETAAVTNAPVNPFLGSWQPISESVIPLGTLKVQQDGIILEDGPINLYTEIKSEEGQSWFKFTGAGVQINNNTYPYLKLQLTIGAEGKKQLEVSFYENDLSALRDEVSIWGVYDR